jgi:hypothetical protein
MCCEQYPDLSFKFLEIYLKGKWPARLFGLHFIYLFFLVIPSLTLYPWDKMSKSVLKSCIFNIYHVHKIEMSDDEKYKHANDYICTYLIPFKEIIESVYKVDPKLKALTNSLPFPIINIFGSMVLKCSPVQSNEDIIGYFIETLFLFAFKSGSAKSTDLSHIANIKKDSISQLKKICESSMLGFRFYLENFSKQIPFFMKTQPKLIEVVMDFIGSIDLSTLVLDRQFVDLLVDFMQPISSPYPELKCLNYLNLKF